MVVTKVTTKRYEVTFYPNAPFFKTWGKFREARERVGMSTKPFSKCFICEQPFADDDNIVFINVKGKGNMFACTKCCAEHHKED